MVKLGWAVFLWNFLLTAGEDHWLNYAWMVIGAAMIVGGYQFAKR